MGRNKYPEETVAKILDAALELFCAQGYEGTSIQDIVDRLDGMTKGAVYHHFKSKEEIFNAAFDRAMAPVVEARQKLFEDRRLDGAQKLQRLYSADSIVPQVELWRRMSPAADPIKSSRLLAIQFQAHLMSQPIAAYCPSSGKARRMALSHASTRSRRQRP